MGLFIDDGSKERKHRKNIVNPRFASTGMAYCAHAKYGAMLVVVYGAGQYD